MYGIQDVINRVMDAQREHVEKRFAEMPVGSILCVHDKSSDTDVRDEFKVKFTLESHILSGEEKCDAKVRRTQYGPKG